MKKRKRNVGKRLSILTIALAFVVVIIGLLLFNQWLNKKNKTESVEIAKVEDGIKTINASDIYYDNYWAKSIITNIVDQNVPIPEGLEYIQGTKETGVIVKDKNSGGLMLWIPYDENVTEEGMEEYYQNCEYSPMDVDTKEAIEHYGGFYVTLENNNQYEVLKQVENDSYAQAYNQVKSIYENSETINSHLIHKTELAQVLAYSKKIGLSLTQTQKTGETRYQIQMTANTNTGDIAQSAYTVGLTILTPEMYSYLGEDTVAILHNNNTVIIPGGFKQVIYEKEKASGVDKDVASGKVVKIEDVKNPELRYVWVEVPKGGFKQAKETLKKYYHELDTIYNCENAEDKIDEEYKNLQESVETFGGFYIAEAELGINETGETISTARGMKLNESKVAGVNRGEYYRGTDIKSYDKAVEIANQLHQDNNSVVSHLTYGVEWDLTMLWILNSNQNKITKQDLIVNSKKVAGAKYEGTIQLDKEGNLTDASLDAINGIYGLAGNLVELTQETIKEEDGKEYRVSRGGSYLYPGNEYSVASRMEFTDDIIAQGDDIGFRNCLFININVKDQNQLTDYRNEIYRDFVENYIEEHYADRKEESWIVKEQENTKQVIDSLKDMTQIYETAIHFQEYIENNKNQNGVKLISHRGNSNLAPENTIPGFELAKQNGFYYVECDVQFTKDNQPVIFHDDNVEKLMNGNGEIQSLTLEQVKQLRFKDAKEGYQDTTIPTFEEFIDTCYNVKLHPYIEMKKVEITEEQAQILFDIVNQKKMIHNVTWISSDIGSLKNIKKVYDSYPGYQNLRLGYVVYFEPTDEQINSIKQLETNGSQVFIDANFGYCNDSIYQKISDNDLDIEVWTAQDHDKIRELLKKNVKGITTDVTKIN